MWRSDTTWYFKEKRRNEYKLEKRGLGILLLRKEDNFVKETRNAREPQQCTIEGNGKMNYKRAWDRSEYFGICGAIPKWNTRPVTRLSIKV